MLVSPNGNDGHHQHQHHAPGGQPHDDEMLSLSLSECGDDAAAAATAAGDRHDSEDDDNDSHVVDVDDDAEARAHESARHRSHFESSMESFAAANGLSTAAETGHHSHDDLTPLAMPSSPSLLQLTGSPTSAGLHAHQHHHHHHQMHQHHHQMAQQHHTQQAVQHQYQQHHQQQQQAQQHARQSHHILGSLSMNILGSSALADASAVQAYFQHDPDAALTASVTNFSREFSELQKSVAGLDERRLADAISDKLEAATSDGPAKSELKKRKGGANVSIDLQTKIRLIELAEEYQYDPKAAVRVKGEPGGAASAKEQISGIRLAAQFGLNKSTVSRILKRKDEYKKAYYKDNISGCSKHINKKSKFEKLNRLVENWFDMTREKKAAVSDTLIRDVGKRFAEELGIDDFRASNGWVRSLRNRKESQTRNMSVEALEREKVKKDAEAIERMRLVFPNGMKDLSSFFKDLATFLEKDCGSSDAAASSNAGTDAASAVVASYTDLVDDTLRDDERVADEFQRKKMVETLRTWSHELVESELSRLKKRLKPRQVANL